MHNTHCKLDRIRQMSCELSILLTMRLNIVVTYKSPRTEFANVTCVLEQIPQPGTMLDLPISFSNGNPRNSGFVLPQQSVRSGVFF